MITSKELAEKIHMFYNLLYHLDDYIKNKKERKGQLHLSKNIRLVLREVISSKNNVKYFINKEEIDSYLSKILKSTKSQKDKELNEQLKSITPLSFNQKNLNTINLFYNTKNEAFVLNYIILDKIFSVIRFCFVETLKKKKNEFLKNFESSNNNNFALRKIDERETNYFQLNESNLLIMRNNLILNKGSESKKEESYDTTSTNKGLKRITSNQAFRISKINDLNKKSLVSINIPALINNNYNCNNITTSQNIQDNDFIKLNSNLLRNLRWQVKIIDDKIKLSQIKEKPDKNIVKKIITIKKTGSFPLIKTHKNVEDKSCEKKRKKEIEDTSLISESKAETKNIFANLIKSKKINYPRSTLFNNKLMKQNKSGVSNHYDYKKILPLFHLSKSYINPENVI